jgi:hypothetical protein
MRFSVALVLALSVTVPSGAAARPVARPVAGTTCQTFPADNYWRADISDLPVHARSDQWLANMSSGRDLHPDFGPNAGGADYGIPITVVPRDHRRVRVRFTYADESDHVRYPLGRDTRIEGGSDRHAIIVDRGSCRLFETFATRKRDGRWYAGSGATWSLRSNDLRPDGWTSADAAGLPILHGLLRWNEVRNRRVNHAIRFNTDITRRAHLWPARHDAGSQDGTAYPPMGARFRLRAGFPTEGYGAGARAVIRAMKRYGLVLADNGSPWFFQGERNGNWPDRLISELKTIPASSFVAVDTAGLKVSRDSAQVR